MFTRIESFLSRYTTVVIVCITLFSAGLHGAILCVKPLPKVEDWYDGLTYINSPCNYFDGEFDPFRTPVYPWFINTVGLVSQCDSQQLSQLPVPMAVAQILLFLASIPIFFDAVKHVLPSRTVQFVCTLVYALSLQLIYWNFIIHTESLSTVLAVVFFWLMVRYIDQPSLWSGIGASTMVPVLVLLRPSFVYLAALLLVFWLFRMIFIRSELRLASLGLMATLGAILVILGYCEANRRTSGLFTISTVSLVNQFDDIINSGVHELSSDTRMVAEVESLLASEPKHGEIHSPTFQNLQKAGYSLPQIQTYVSQCHRAGLWDWTLYKLRTAAGVLRSPFFVILYLAGVWELSASVFSWIRRRSIPWLRLGIWGMVYGALVVAILGGNSLPGNPDYIQRLITPALPMFYVMCFAIVCSKDRHSQTLP